MPSPQPETRHEITYNSYGRLLVFAVGTETCSLFPSYHFHDTQWRLYR